MTTNPNSRLASNCSAIAERLRAHARLCEQIAHGCENEPTAKEFKRIAHDCNRAALEIALASDVLPHTRH